MTVREALDAASSLEHELRSLIASRCEEFDALGLKPRSADKQGDDHLRLTAYLRALAEAIDLGIYNSKRHIEEAHGCEVDQTGGEA
tara:strand:- start:131 stop:388 length:258 start_codon:yes stop_codon:yes gene_type:complete